MSTNVRNKTKTEKARQYYTELDAQEVGYIAKKTHKCIIPNCGKLLSAANASNLVAHLRFCHKEIYADEIIGSVNDAEYYIKKRLKFVQNCAEMIAINCRPFSALLDSGFRKFIEEDFNELKNAGYAVDLNDNTEIKNYIKELANKVMKKIKEETKDRFISLMVDAGSKNGRSFLGISVQYMLEGSVCVRCLGTVELKQSQTAAYIKEVITNCLLSFDIRVDQIISITTDNGANMLAMVDLFNADDDVDIADNEGEILDNLDHISRNCDAADIEDATADSVSQMSLLCFF